MSIAFTYGTNELQQLNSYIQHEGYYVGYVNLSTDIAGLQVTPTHILLSGQNRFNNLTFNYNGDKKISSIFQVYMKDDKGNILSAASGNLSVK